MLFKEYPDVDDDSEFYPINLNKREFYQNRQLYFDPTQLSREKREQIVREQCNPTDFQLLPHQRFVGEYMRPRTPYHSLLLFHGLGSGKTASALTIAERFKEYVTERGTKIFVLGNKTSRIAFINELLGDAVGNIYLAEEERNNPTAVRRAKRKISKYYEFLGYLAFANHVNGHSKLRGGIGSRAIKKLREGDVSNSLIIIDEAHNVIPKGTTDKLIFDALAKVLTKSKNVRLVLLTGTPIYDNPTEIVYLIHLLLRENIQDEDAIRRIGKTANTLFDSSTKLSSQGMAFLKKAKGYVSYVKGFNALTFPKRVDAGRPIPNVLKSLSVYRCWMSPHQVAGYVKALEEDRKTDWGLKQKAQYASMVVYPDGSYGADGFKKYRGNFHFLKEKTLATYSCKLSQLLGFIRGSPGPVFVHSVFVEKNGIDVIKKMLNVNGIRDYAVIKGKTPTLEAERIRARFSSKANKDGNLIKILIGSEAVGEGMNLRNVRRVFIMEPHFNVSKIEQAIGRAIRHCSHVDLNPKDRKVVVFRMVASIRRLNRGPLAKLVEDYENEDNPIEPDLQNRTVDELIYSIAETKLDKANAIEEVLQSDALDFQLKMARQNKKLEELDESTYDFARDVIRLAQVKAFIKGLFRKNTVWSLKDITKETIEGLSDSNDELVMNQLSDMVKWALDIILTDKETVRNRFGRQGYVIYRGRYYIFNLFGMSEKATLVQRNLPSPVLITQNDISLFLDTDPRFARDVTKTGKKTSKQISERQIQADLKRIRNKMERENVPLKDQVIGCYKDTRKGKRFALLRPPSKKTENLGFQATGTICAESSKIYKVHDLIDLALRLGVGRMTEVDKDIRFEYEVKTKSDGKYTLQREKGKSRFAGKSIRDYICDLIRQKLEATDRTIEQCPTKRSRGK